MEQKLMTIDELGSKDSDGAKHSNQVEDVQMSVQCNLDRKFEVLESSDMDTEFSRFPQVLDQNRQDFHRNMNTSETFTQENSSSVSEPNQNYFCDSKGMFESVGSVRFETAFMQNSLSRLACEDDDFRIDLHPSRVNQSHFKYSGANVSQKSMTTANRLTIIMPVKGEGCIDGFSNEESSSDGVISETERREIIEDPVMQSVNSGLSDTDHQEENCKREINLTQRVNSGVGDTDHQKENCDGVVRCIQYAEREVPSNTKQYQRDTDAEHGFKASLEATAYQLEGKLSSAIETECQGQQQLTTETNDNKAVCDAAAEDCRYVNLNFGIQEENVKALMVIQSHSDPGEMIQIGCEESKQTETWCPPLSIKIKGAQTQAECISSTFAVDHEIENENVIATDHESTSENFESAVESAVYHEIVGESPIATECESVVEGNIYHHIVHESLLATDCGSAGESPIATDCESVVEGNIYHQIVHESLLATDCESAGESPIATDCESVVENNIYHQIVHESLLATDCESAVESPIATECESIVEGNIYHEIVGKSLLATDSESAVESAIGHGIVGESLMASVVECKSALESNSFTVSERFCGSETLNDLDLSQMDRCDSKVISNNCNDVIGHQNVCRNEFIVELCNQTEEKLKDTEKDETKAYSNDAGDDFQIESKAENTNEDINEIQDEICEDLEKKLNAPTEDALKDDINWSNSTEVNCEVKHNFEAERINYLEDNWRAGIFVIPFPVLGESAEVARCQIEQDINLKIEDEAMCGSTDEKTSEEKAKTDMDEDQSVINVENHHESELDDRFDEELMEENRETLDIADASGIESYSSEYMSMNEIMVNDRNEHGSKTKAEIDCYDCNENTMKEELSIQMKTEYAYHLKTEANKEFEVETSSKIVILVQDEVEEKLEIAQLPASGHQTGTDQIQLQHDAENKMDERLLIEGESQTEKFVDSQKIMSGNLCEMANNMIDGKHGTMCEKLVAEIGEGEQLDENECHFENGVGVENEQVVEGTLGANSYLDLWTENKRICHRHERKDYFGQHGIDETQNETVAKGEILNEVFQSSNSTSKVDDTAECLALHNLSDVLLSEGLLKNHPTSNTSLTEAELNCSPFDEFHSRNYEDRRSGLTISMDGCSSDVGACITTSTENQIFATQTFFEGDEKHLECSYQFMPPILTGITKILDAFPDRNLTRHGFEDLHGDQQRNFTVQDFYQNPRSVQKEASSLDFLLSSTVEKSYCDTSDSSSFQAKTIDCYQTTADIDFAEPTSVSDQTFSDKNRSLIKDFGHCDDGIPTFSHMDYGLRSNSGNITMKRQCNVPDLETNEEDSNSCHHTVSDVLNQTDCLALAKPINNPQKQSTTRNANEFIEHFTVSQDDETSCFVQNVCGSENFVLTYPGNSLLLHSSTVHTRCVNRIQTDEAFWRDVTPRKTESYFSQVPQNPTVTGDEPLKCEEALPERNQEIVVPQQTDNGNHLQQELHVAENFDVFAVPQLPADSCAVREGSSLGEFNAFGEVHVSDVRVADRNITQSDFTKRCMNRDQLKQNAQEVPSSCFMEHDPQISMEKTSTTCISARNFSLEDPSPAEEISSYSVKKNPQEVPSCYFMEDDPQISTEKTSATCISARSFSSNVPLPAEEISHYSMKKNPQEVPSCYFMENDPQISTEKISATCISARKFSVEDPSPAEEISERVFEIPADEQQVPSVESMKHENEMPDVSCLSSHLEETLYEEPPAKRRCFEVDIGSNFDHEIDEKWSEDKHETNVGGYTLTNLTGGGKERVPLYAWKTVAEPDFEDDTGMAEQSYPISRDTSAALPLVIPRLSKCQKPLRLGLSRRYRAPTRLHPNYATTPSSD